MITHSPYSHRNIIKPGRMPEPLKPVHTCDSPDVIAICLKCPVKGGCRPSSPGCQVKTRPSKDRTAERIERDKKICEMVKAGWKNKAICEELRIKKATLSEAKKRLKERGEIN